MRSALLVLLPGAVYYLRGRASSAVVLPQACKSQQPLGLIHDYHYQNLKIVAHTERMQYPLLIDKTIDIQLKLSDVRYSVHTAKSPAHPEQPGPVTTCHSAGGFGFP